MWREYEADYAVALKDESFVRWREAGTRQKAANAVKMWRGIQVTSPIQIGFGTGAVLKRLQEPKFAKHFACLDLSHSTVTFARNVRGNSLSRTCVASATSLLCRNVAFDVATLSHIIEHLHEPAQVLAEASRIACYVVVEVPTEVVLSNAIGRSVLRNSYASIHAAGQVEFWSTRSISRLLKNDCCPEILENHGDRTNKEAEFFGKSGVGLAKPKFKQTLKALLPAAVYTRVPTSHSTFLCKRAGT
jgi:hypothetical protein